MAATDQTYRKQKTLNVVFAASCVLMFASVIWMLVDDYNRPFKQIQREFRDVETRMSLGLMLAQMPDASEVERLSKEVAKKRGQVEAERQRIDEQLQNREGDPTSIHDLTARREQADADYKMVKAEYDSKMSFRNIAVHEHGRDSEAVGALDREIASLKARLAEARRRLDEAEDALETLVNRPLQEFREKEGLPGLEAELKRVTGTFDRFAKAAAEKDWTFGDTFRGWPILDGFASPVKIQQTVLHELTIDYGGFKYVTRYDRCATCHLGIDRAAYDYQALLALGDEKKQKGLQDKLDRARALLQQRADNGETLGFDPDDLPEEIEALSLSPQQAAMYAAHPRLDLFVDSNSPHPAEKFGCTICHGGQGSATDFTLASHTPNNAAQKERWQGGGDDGHHWHAMHYWDFPMLPGRFTESGCVKCHHQVTDLVRYGSQEEAPKLLEGYNLVKENGCFGCHEISGSKTDAATGRLRPVGPDLRLEPTPPLEWLSAKERGRRTSDPLNPPGTLRKIGPSLRRIDEKTNADWLASWIKDPRGFRPSTKMPHFYGLSTNSEEFLKKDFELRKGHLGENGAAARDQSAFPDAEIRSIVHYLQTESEKYLKDGEDSTREITREQVEDLQNKLKEGKLNAVDLKDLGDLTRRYGDLCLMSNPRNRHAINDYTDQVEGLHTRIQNLHNTDGDAAAAVKELEEAMRRLRQASMPIPRLASDEAYLIGADSRKVRIDKVPEPAQDTAKGKRLFTERGCLACHSHLGAVIEARDQDFNDVRLISNADFGPDLTRIAAKLGEGKGGKEARRWLIQWVMNPNVHHPRTRMPVTHLTVAEAAAIADWLLSQKADWTPNEVSTPSSETLVELARLALEKAPGVGRLNADEVLKKGLSQAIRDRLAPDADEQLLVDETKAGEPIDEQRLMRYIGKKAIGRLGCYGCHDIPGFEFAKPIGTPLNDWGEKDPERLAFEESKKYVESHFDIVQLRDDPKNPDRPSKEWLEKRKRDRKYERFYFDALKGHSREGFLHLKLQQPRSYDYARVRAWDDRLRMPQFRFSHSGRREIYNADEDRTMAEDLDAYRSRLANQSEGNYDLRAQYDEAKAREAVMTFILGLVAEPIPQKYVHSPKPDRLAQARGRHVLEKFNCAGCHQVRAGVYEFRVPEGEDSESKALREKVYEALRSKYDELAAPLGGQLSVLESEITHPDSNAWTGVPTKEPGRLRIFGVNPYRDEEQKTLSLWLTQAVRFPGADGAVLNLPAGQEVALPADALVQSGAHSEPYGGDIARLLVPHLREADSLLFKTNEDGLAASPPPLLREGERVRPEWLYKFLLGPTTIRPLTVLRMPRFNMSEEEARALVDYFAAAARLENPGLGLTKPFLAAPQSDESFWRQKTAEYVARLKEKNPDHLADGRKQLAGVWDRYLEDRVTRVERNVAGAEFAVARAREAVEAAQKKLDATKGDAETAKARQELTTAQGGLMAEEAKLKDAKKGLEDLQATAKAKAGSDAYKDFEQTWEEEQVYAADAYKLLTDAKSICMTCHSAGDVRMPSGEKGPNLGLAAERLRPEWTVQWISSPRRLTTYLSPMPQNFKKGTRFTPHYMELNSRGYVEAARDVLMDLPRIADLPVNRYRLAPKGGK